MKISEYEWESIPRNEVFGGSEMAAVIGRSKWSNKQDVVKRKLFGDDVKQNKAMFWGTQLEAPIAEVYKDRFCTDETYLFDPVPGGKPQVRHPDYPWLAGSADRLIVEKETHEVLGGLEIKAIGTFSKKAWKNGVPDYYDIQAQTYMMCYGLPVWEFFVLCGGQDDFHLVLEENPFLQEEIIQKGGEAYRELIIYRKELELMETVQALEAYENLLIKGREEHEKETQEAAGNSAALKMG